MNELLKSTREILLSLYEKLASGCGIKTITESTQAALENPLITADKSCHVLCAAGIPEEDNNQVWKTVEETGYYPPEYLEAMANNEKYGKIYTAEAPVMLLDKFSQSRSLMFRVTYGRVVMGFAQLVERYHPITASDREIFTAFCKIAGTALRGQRPEENERKKSYEYVITEALNGNLYGDRLQQWLKAVNIEPKHSRCLFVIEKNDGKMYAEYIRNCIEAIVHNCRCVVYNERLLVLVDLKNGILMSPDDRTKLKDFLLKNGLSCGGSGGLESMNDLVSAYNQAVTASRIGRQMKGYGPMYFLWEYTTYQMCDILFGQCNLMDFCNPLIIAIGTYDKKNNTHFLQTLEEYITSGCSPVKTAKQLGVHRNTIDYRLGRMKELFDLNVEDQNLMFSFKQSFQIIDYLKKNDRDANVFHSLK